MLQLKRSWDKRILFFFHIQISFPFFFSCTCLVGKFKKAEYTLICKVFTEVFLIARIPHSTVLITGDVQGCSVKKDVLKDSQENTCAQETLF